MGTWRPAGAVIKASASKKRRLLSHMGPAVVFDGTEDLARRIDNESFDVIPDSVLVLRGIGPVGFPGMPEAGLIPIPRKLAVKGVKDMPRISGGRMSGRIRALCWGLLRMGILSRLMSKGENKGKKKTEHWSARRGMRGNRGLYMREVNQADLGADFDFLTAAGPS
ncbi:dihydroxy-acid and 6-phosphogluconate dehydratase [Xylariaceae sp. FL0255]|nr:dihydroxy-acid and 6-phosphogluconate dehydratase [Xylariaceae sp. FL0255]